MHVFAAPQENPSLGRWQNFDSFTCGCLPWRKKRANSKDAWKRSKICVFQLFRPLNAGCRLSCSPVRHAYAEGCVRHLFPVPNKNTGHWQQETSAASELLSLMLLEVQETTWWDHVLFHSSLLRASFGKMTNTLRESSKKKKRKKICNASGLPLSERCVPGTTQDPLVCSWIAGKHRQSKGEKRKKEQKGALETFDFFKRIQM